MAYTSDAYVVLGEICEPPLQYHLLRRPYQLVPLTAVRVPVARYQDAAGAALPADAPAAAVARTVYDVEIRPGIRWQPHPCFARGPDGKPLPPPPDAALEGLTDPVALGPVATRELTAADYVTAIRRLADPRLEPGCPILSTMAKYLQGLEGYATAMRKDLEAERKRRRAAGGALYSQEADELEHPIRLDPAAHPLPGVRQTGRYTFRLTIVGRYPQILYWLAMPFFSPVPQEALDWCEQPALKRHNVTLAQFPIGTGPYRIGSYDPNREIVLVRNEHHHPEAYPADGEPADRTAGLLADAGRPLPFIDRIVFKLEKESIPRWIKFQQGWFDGSSVPSEGFDQAVQFADSGALELSGRFKDRGFRLETEVELATYYFAFNMLDDVWGGYAPARRKLRHAVAIALDAEERIQIFNNGLGAASQGFIPPGIFGGAVTADSYDPFVYDWDAKANAPRRKSLAEARRLLAEAGYPGGRDRAGRQLELRFANAWNSPELATQLKWISQKLDAIGVLLKSETTDYNRFQEKASKGDFQILSWGWYADYPDPENFLFLLYGPNGTKTHDGENHSNYDSPAFNALFRQLETMENSPARLRLILKANRVAQEDAPLVWGYHPMVLGLFHDWVANVKPHAVSQNLFKYYRIDPARRAAFRARENRPVLWPLVLGFAVLAALAWPALRSVRERAERA